MLRNNLSSWFPWLFSNAPPPSLLSAPQSIYGSTEEKVNSNLAITERLHKARKYVSKKRRGATKICYATIGFVALLFSFGGLGVVETLRISNRKQGELHDKVWSSYEYSCPLSEEIFDSLEPVALICDDGGCAVDPFSPGRYCATDVNGRTTFENLKKLSEECLSLLKMTCINIDVTQYDDHMATVEQWTGISFMLFATIMVCGFAIAPAYLNREGAIANALIEQKEGEKLVSIGVIPSSDVPLDWKKIEETLEEQKNLNEKEVFWEGLEKLLLDIFKTANSPMFFLVLEYLDLNLKHIVRKFLYDLRCDSYQIKPLPASKKEASFGVSILKKIANLGSVSDNPYQFLEETKRMMLPAKMIDTIHDYIDFDECGVIAMFVDEKKEAVTQKEKMASAVQSLDEEEKTTTVKPTLFADEQALDEIKTGLLGLKQNAVYVLVNSTTLLYFNRARQEQIEIGPLEPEQITKFNNIAHPELKIQMLTREQLSDIASTIGHEHYQYANMEAQPLSLQKLKLA